MNLHDAALPKQVDNDSAHQCNEWERNGVKHEPEKWKTSPFGWIIFWPCRLAQTHDAAAEANRGFWPGDGHAGSIQQRTLIRNSLGPLQAVTHPQHLGTRRWNQLCASSSVEQMDLSDTRPYHTHILRSCSEGEKQRNADFWGQVGKDKCFKNTNIGRKVSNSNFNTCWNF